MHGACSTNGRDERCMYGFGRAPEEKNHLKDLDVDGNIILRWIFKNWDGAWTELI